ncbi:Predicted arabinose efflux permease, MFS family [Stigmatella aurantiaca]|uniref:Predicted arabinose efflux permease, MFS family n=1 Tax=Stigmatella aurantiaca TaxID=41 RepID=A0A1H7GKY4_STIAU|nr:MFS transporter [Stigmatella aurantiaca]SEK36525.1 Predicted arabinose efflux permease, MFS family [Stigmatella aurantiaca]
MKRFPSKLGLLGALYFVQGMPFGFQATALPVYLRTQGVSVTAIGFLGLLSLPWMFKALWAPLVDRYGSARIGRRKSWILPLQAALAATCALAAFVPVETGLPALLGLIFVMNLLAATQDIAVDGFAVDSLRPEEMGLGNAAQVVGYKLGMLTGGGLLVWASQSIGWRGLFLSMAALSLIVFGVTAFAREPAPREHSGERTTWREVLSRLRQVFLLPGTGWVLLFIATYKFGESLSDVLYKVFLVQEGISPAQIGLWVGTWGMAASLLGSTAGGLLATRMPLLGALTLTASLRILPLAGRWWLAQFGVSDASIIGVTMAEEFFGGALTTVMFAFMMSQTDPRIGATHYTLFASLEVLGKAPGGPIGGLLVGEAHWSYAQAFLLGTVLSVTFLFLLLPLRGLRASRPAPGPA